MDFDISNLNEKQLEFYKFSMNNIDKFINLTIKEIAQIYGCGISFIYKYFEKINVSGIKEYILLLVNQMYKKQSLCTKVNEIFSKVKSDALLVNFEEEINEYSKIIKQNEKINNIKKILYNSKKVYGIAFGHSQLAIKDFLGFYNYINSNIEFIDYDKNNDLKNYLEDNCVIIFYSIRFINEKFKKILSQIQKSNKNIKTILITSNTNKNLKKYFTIVFYINNVMKYQNNLEFNFYLGPLNSFLMFNNYLKAEIFKDKKNLLLKNKVFLKETLGWTDYIIAKDI